MRSIVILSFALSCATAALAELSPEHDAWGKGPAQHLMTAAEKSEWERVRDDAAAERFVALFWARRDPTPATAENENRALFDARVAYANQKFQTPKLAGAMTPMGRVFLLLGAPRRMARNNVGPVSTVQSGFAGDLSMSVSNARGQEIPTEIWFYEDEQVPAFSPVKAFEIAFTDQYGTQDWELSRTPRTNVKHLLDLAVESFLVSPDLTSVPVHAPAGSLQTASLQSAVDEFRAGGTESRGTVHLTWGEFATHHGQNFVAVQLYVPRSARAGVEGADRVFALIADGSGRIVRALEQPAPLHDANGDLWTDFSLPLQPGEHTGVFGIARRGEPLVMTRAALPLRGVEAAAPATSPLILSNRIYPLAEAQRPTDPFAFGGLKVVPKGDRTFRSSDELWYFLELRNPGLDANGQPSLHVKLDVEGTAAGNSVKLAAPLMKAETQPVKDVPGRFVTGSSIRLTRFGAGEYTIRVRLVDSVLKKSYEFEERFRVAQ